MSEFETFHYKTLEEVKEQAEKLHVHLPFAENTKCLGDPLKAGQAFFHNRLGIAPMEGADSLPDGSPSELTLRRYVREAEGGSAVIWFEAIAIVPEGRSSAHQLMLTRENLESYKKLCAQVKEAGIRANGYAPYLIMQANHSGRYSNPQGRPAPMIAYRHPEYEKLRAADDSCIVSDEYLKGLTEKFAQASELAREAGFDAVDIKSCHGYLLAELSSAYTRPGMYGGSFENRTRLLRDSVQAAKAYETESFMVTARIGIYDGFAWPYGFGVKEGGDAEPDLAEPEKLIEQLYKEYGLRLVNLTMGNPYVSIHVTRPFDHGKYVPDEHPLRGIARMIGGIGKVKQAVPEMKILASAPTYLRQYSDLFAAGAVEEGLCDGMLFGRMSFADPAFPNQILKEGRIDPKQVCVTCGKCGDLIRAGKPTGCVVRDSALYLPYYRQFMEEQKGVSSK
ncbi:MAG: flavin oxidoreductase/NADH oxidase [Eubacteriales bacterium]|nr:flavin oxidoreductase/NADH oxidase [Eubacteriales bacterium]